MDILSHGLWGALLAKAVNARIRKSKRGGELRKLDPLLAGFWGFVPDLVAFTPVFLLFGGGILSGHVEPDRLPRPHEAEPVTPDTAAIFWITHALYSVTHSAIVFAAVFFGVWAFRTFVLRRTAHAFVWELMPWLLHILMDLPTHSYRIYPTPILWPVSAWRFDGIPWSTPWIFALNYAVLIAGFYALRRTKGRTEEVGEVEEPQLAPASERTDS